MIDIVDKKKRSQMMAGIRSSNTKPEILTRTALHKHGYRYRLNSKIGKIKPDIVLRSRKIAVFVHGCYWHQHKGCRLAYSDRKYSEQWKTKFKDNILRDQKVQEKLINEGWRVAVVWECATRDPGVFNDVINKVTNWIDLEKSMFFQSEYTYR